MPDAAPEDQPDASTIPHGLHARGASLWTALGHQRGTAPGELALEACRTADRLDELDRIIAGKGVLQLMKFRLTPDWWDDEGDRHVHVEVGFQSVLSETRQQQGRLAKLLEDLGVTGARAKTLTRAPKRPANVRDQLRERREAREQEA